MTRMIDIADPDILQLHGNETPMQTEKLLKRHGLPIIKAICVASADDMTVCGEWDGVADWLLFDAKSNPGGLPGGTGHIFDWTLLANHAWYRQNGCWLAVSLLRMLGGPSRRRMPKPLMFHRELSRTGHKRPATYSRLCFCCPNRLKHSLNLAISHFHQGRV